jgi:MATE family multidrug resistance protein
MAISFNITWFLATGALLYFLKYRNPINQVFFMPEEESYKEVWEQFKYEVVVGAMSWADFIAIEVLSIFTGRLSTDEIAGFTSASTVYRMPAPFIIGMIITSITFIGQAMGNGDTEKAKKVIKVVAAISEGFGLLMLIIAIFWRDTILQKFATDSSFAVASAVLTVHLFGCPVDSVQGVLSATLRGIKKERIGAIMIIICDYGVAIPCAFIACFVIGMGAPGITLGSVISHYCKLFLFGREIIFRTNWEKQIEIVKSQLKKKESGDIEFKTFKDERAGDMIQLDTN